MNLEKKITSNLETENQEVKQETEMENNYDQEAPENEIDNFQKEIEEKVGAKAEELDISKKKLVELADLDLESLEAEKLKVLNLKQGELNFIRESIGRAINEFRKDEETGGIIEKAPSSTDKLLKFVKEHKKVISVGQLALYLSAFGSPSLGALAEDDVKVEVEGHKISLKDLVDNMELIKEINQTSNVNAPIDILQEYFSKPYVYEDFSMNFRIGNNNTGEEKIFLDFMGYKSDLQKDLKIFGADNNFGEIDYNTFQDNKEEIAEIVSKHLNVSKEEIEKYFDKSLEVNISKISVVEFEDFKINKNLEFQKSETVEKYEKISGKYDLSIPEEKVKVIEEFEEWGKNNGYDDVWVALNEENLKGSFLSLSEKIKGESIISPAQSMQEPISLEQLTEEKKQFENLLFRELENSGYSVSELKKIGEKNPEKIIAILAGVISKNVEYDYDKYKLIEEEKYSEIERQNPYLTLKNHKGVCEDYSELFATSKYFLEKKGIPNLDKFVVLRTTPEKDLQNHMWNNLITIDRDGKLIITAIDITWADDENISKISEKLNAVDEKHYYSSLPEKSAEVHQKALKKIRDWNNLVKQEKLRQMLTTYDPKLHRREREIKEVKSADE